MPVTAIEAPSAAKSSINPISGVFGSGQIQLIFKDGNFIAPITGKYRIRVWGAGGRHAYKTGGAGGGFAMKVIELNEGDIIPVTVAQSILGNTSSFGAYVSATSGETVTSEGSNSVGGTGVGGDVNYQGGEGYYDSSNSMARCGGGAASILGDGGDGQTLLAKGGSSGGSSRSSADQNITAGHNLSFPECLETGLDLIAAGCGGSQLNIPASGGGASSGNSTFSNTGFPAGGAGDRSENNLGQNTGADGLVTVEY